MNNNISNSKQTQQHQTQSIKSKNKAPTAIEGPNIINNNAAVNVERTPSVSISNSFGPAAVVGDSPYNHKPNFANSTSALITRLKTLSSNGNFNIVGNNNNKNNINRMNGNYNKLSPNKKNNNEKESFKKLANSLMLTIHEREDTIEKLEAQCQMLKDIIKQAKF